MENQNCWKIPSTKYSGVNSMKRKEKQEFLEGQKQKKKITCLTLILQL